MIDAEVFFRSRGVFRRLQGQLISNDHLAIIDMVIDCAVSFYISGHMLVSVQPALLLWCGALLVALLGHPPHYPSYAAQCGDSSMWKCVLPSVIAATHADCCFCHGFYCNGAVVGALVV